MALSLKGHGFISALLKLWKNRKNISAGENPVYPEQMSRASDHLANFYTVSPSHSLLSVLADHLLQQDTFGAAPQQGPVNLSDIVLLLPTRRAVKAMGEVFLARSKGAACIMPRMRALGDVDEAELLLGEVPLIPADELELPATIPALERQFRLAKLIESIYPEIFTHQGDGPASAINPSACLKMARDLIGLLDGAEIEQVSLAQISNLVADRFAENWQQTLDFLKIITEKFPAEIKQDGYMEPVAKRNRLLGLYADFLEGRKENGRIIAAGSTGSTPATARLLKVISSLPRGAVILPGLDPFLDEDSWDRLDEEHPQFAMKQLIGLVGIKRDEVRQLSPPGERAASVRDKIMSEVMRPAETTDMWFDTLSDFTGDDIEAACKGVCLISASSPRDEALVIALQLRSVLEEPGKRAALVTPDRSLAKRVASEMKRWGIEIYDSAGQKLVKGDKARLLLLIAGCVQERFSPVSLLSLLRHPLVCAGLKKQDLSAKTALIETYLLRGPRPAEGLAGLRRAAEKLENSDIKQSITILLSRLEVLFVPLNAIDETAPHSASELCIALLQVFEGLLTDDTGPQPEAIWAGHEGDALGTLFHDIIAVQHPGPLLNLSHLKEFLQTLMADRVLQPDSIAHPRLFILGLLEARLMSFDLVILGSVNEGVWPQIASADPWLNRPMRADINLSAPERRIGLSAHDFVQNVCAPEVTITRSEKVDGVPTVPSRWLLRLKAVLDAKQQGTQLSSGEDWLAWASHMDRAEKVKPALPPRPTPPLEARPRKLSVTRIETWQRDPYAIYARHILGLKRLDDIDADPGAAEKGTLIHKIMERFIKYVEQTGEAPTLALLREIGADEFANWADRPSVTAFWLPRFDRIAVWYAGEEKNLSTGCKKHYTEIDGEIAIKTGGEDFRLTARADRIDLLEDGSLRILDYKTGALPSQNQVGAFAAQMPLEAYIALEGGFSAIGPAPVSHLAYIQMTGAEPPGLIRPAGKKAVDEADIEKLARQTADGLRKLITKFDNKETPYLCRIKPKNESAELDYDHLSRYREWAVLQRWEDRAK